MLDTVSTSAVSPALHLARMGRIHFIVGVLLTLLLLAGLVLACFESGLGFDVILVLSIVLAILWNIGLVALSIRRLRDLGCFAWLAILALVPWVGPLFILTLTLLPGTAANNRYGSPPDAPKLGMTTLAAVLVTGSALFLLYLWTTLYHGFRR